MKTVEHTRQLKFACRFEYGDALPDELRTDGPVPVYGSNGPFATNDLPNTLAPVIVIGRKGSYGKLNWSEVPVFAVDTTYYIDRRHTQCDLRWLFYALQTLELDTGSTDAAVPGLSRESAYSRRLAIPGGNMQRTTAEFLDLETAKIDALVDEKERLLKLLDERRQALITEAVTRGLDPTVPMKPSGVPWLGEIPAHWAVAPLKFSAKVGNGSTPNRDRPEYWEQGYFPWLNSSVVNQEQVTSSDQFVTDAALKECHLPIVQPPAVLIGITGQGRTRGTATILRFQATINQHIAFLKPIEFRYSVEYLWAILSTAYSFLRDESDDAGSTKGAITCEQLANLRLPRPPLDEQEAIYTEIESQSVRIRNVMKVLNEHLLLLKDRRSALIHEAVTGQLQIGGSR